MEELYICQNCGFEAPYDDLSAARDVATRNTPGEPYSDVECPKCGALCLPKETPEIQDPPGKPCHPESLRIWEQDRWASHHSYTRGEWKIDVEEGNTQLGYWDWLDAVLFQIEEDNRVLDED